jgi:hypothetical protein
MQTNTSIKTTPADAAVAHATRGPVHQDSVHLLAAARFTAAVRCDVKVHALWRTDPRVFGSDTTVITPETLPAVQLQLHGPLLLRVTDDGARLNLHLYRSAAIDAAPAIKATWDCVPAGGNSSLLKKFEVLRQSVSSAVPRALCRQVQMEIDQILDESALNTPLFSVSISKTPQAVMLIETCKRGEFDALWGANVYTDVVESGAIASVLTRLRTISVQVSYLDRKQWKQSFEFFRSAHATVTDTGEVLITSKLFDTHESCEDSMILASQERRHRRPSDFPARASMNLTYDQIPYFVPADLRLRAEAFAASEPATSHDEIECEYTVSIPRHALEAWFCAPLERGVAFTSVYTTLSRTLQQRLRDWVPAFWINPAATVPRRMTGLLARLYHCSRPLIGVARADLVPDWMSGDAAQHIWDTGIPELRRRIAEDKMTTMKTARQADLYARRQIEVLSESVWKDLLLPGLVQKQAMLIESFIKLGATCRTLEKSGHISDAVTVRQTIFKAMQTPRQVMRKFFAKVNYEVLVPFLFLEGTNALNRVLKRNYPIIATLTMRAPSGAEKKFCNQTANFPAGSH